MSRFGAAALGAVLLSGAAARDAQAKGARPKRLRAAFGAEDRMGRALKIPPYVVDEMIRSRRDAGYEVSDDEAARIREEARGALVDLNGDRFDDLLVRSDRGANVAGFWLFRNTGRRWEVVLYGIALDLAIRKSRTRGYRDVEVSAASAVKGWGAVYKFDGTRYRPAACREHDLGVGKGGSWGPARRVPCGSDEKPYR